MDLMEEKCLNHMETIQIQKKLSKAMELTLSDFIWQTLLFSLEEIWTLKKKESSKS